MRAAAWTVLAIACAPPTALDGVPETDTDTPVPHSDTDVGSGRVTPLPTTPCADPAARDALGPLQAPLSAGDWGSQAYVSEPRSLFMGGGLTVFDVDGDDRHDILLPGVGQTQLFVQGEDGGFVAAPERLPARGDIDDAATAATAFDADGDGDPDLIVTRYGRAPSYWRNDGGMLTDISRDSAWPLADASRRWSGASAADVDRDGDLDLFVAGHGGLRGVAEVPGDASALLLGDGLGGFRDHTSLLPTEAIYGYTFVAGWFDLDDNGWLDLYIVNDFGDVIPNGVLWNGPDGLSAPEDGAGLDQALDGMGLGVGDIDGVGGPDLVVAGWGNNRLLIEQDGRWFDAHRVAQFDGERGRGQVVGWAVDLVDLDNDGDLDVVEGFGHIWNQQTPPEQPDEIFLNDGEQMVPSGQAWGFDHPGQTRAVLAVDMNRDGWLDLLRRDLSGPATLQFQRCGAAHWTMLTLDDPTTANRRAVGARVDVRSGDRTWRRTLDAGSTSVLASRPPEVHVGLGATPTIDGITVHWPDGGITRYGPQPVDQRLMLHRSDP